MLTVHCLTLDVVVTGILREEVVEVGSGVLLTSHFIDLIDEVSVDCELMEHFEVRGVKYSYPRASRPTGKTGSLGRPDASLRNILGGEWLKEMMCCCTCVWGGVSDQRDVCNVACAKIYG